MLQNDIIKKEIKEMYNSEGVDRPPEEKLLNILYYLMINSKSYKNSKLY